MKQLLLRVPDRLHQRLTARASREGRSVNAIATEMLDLAADSDSGTAVDTIRARASAAGSLGAPSTAAAPQAPSLDDVRESLRGHRIDADALLDAERGPR